MRSLLPTLLIAAVIAAGCTKKPAASEIAAGINDANNAAENEPKKDETINVATTAGKADRRDPKSLDRLYTVAWRSAAISLNRGGIEEGKMNGVSGTAYEQVKGEETAKSTFTADTGYAKKDTQTLFLEGNVIVKSPAYKATMKAKKLEWLPDVKRYRATGDVILSTPTGTLGPTDSLLASSDLKRFGTPDSFPAK